MAAPKWEAGKLYLPGDIVQPKTSQPASPVSLQNPGWETGDETGWDVNIVSQSGSVFLGVRNKDPHTGVYIYAMDASSGNATVEGLNDEVIPTAAGATVSARMYMRRSGATTASAQLYLNWYDAGSSLISTTTSQTYTQPETWIHATVSGVAPAGAASVRVGFRGVVSGDGDFRFDDATFTDTGGAVSGLIYRAVQAAPGLSGSTEPAWPLTLGVQVVDNEVTWEAISATRITWEASPILVSGPTEPTWPTDVGDTVPDNTIAWEAVSRRVTDDNCPNTKVVAIAASKVYAADGDIVRFSATVNPLDWTTQEDAGYLPVGLQQYGANDVQVLGLYRTNLTPFSASTFQNWQVDEDPRNMAILDAMEGIGSVEQRAAQPVSNDLFYLARLGVRTVGIAGGSTNLAAGDVGMPIDPLVQSAVTASDAGPGKRLSTYYPSSGQYWLMMPGVDGAGVAPGFSETFVYTMNKIGSIGAWSRYTYPWEIEDTALLGNDLYIKAGDSIFIVDETSIEDQDEAGDPVEVVATIRWPYLDFGAPGVTKGMIGFDMVGNGTVTVQFGYDQRNFATLTPAYEVTADTVTGSIIGFPWSAASWSPQLQFSSNDGEWEWLAMQMYLQDFRTTS